MMKSKSRLGLNAAREFLGDALIFATNTYSVISWSFVLPIQLLCRPILDGGCSRNKSISKIASKYDMVDIICNCVLYKRCVCNLLMKPGLCCPLNRSQWWFHLKLLRTFLILCAPVYDVECRPLYPFPYKHFVLVSQDARSIYCMQYECVKNIATASRQKCNINSQSEILNQTCLNL